MLARLLLVGCCSVALLGCPPATDLGQDCRMRARLTAWAANTDYVGGDVRGNGGNIYRVSVGGTSAASGGPTGTGQAVGDGTVTWQYLSLTGSTLPDGGGARDVTEGEIKQGASKDFLSFGSTDCEDFVCVRDSNYPKGDGGPDSVAHGYCSTYCEPTSSCAAAAQPDPNNPKVNISLSCRALLLDATTLASICAEADGGLERCKKFFGGATTPYFCVRGGNADGGGI